MVCDTSYSRSGFRIALCNRWKLYICHIVDHTALTVERGIHNKSDGWVCKNSSELWVTVVYPLILSILSYCSIMIVGDGDLTTRTLSDQLRWGSFFLIKIYRRSLHRCMPMVSPFLTARSCNTTLYVTVKHIVWQGYVIRYVGLGRVFCPYWAVTKGYL